MNNNLQCPVDFITINENKARVNAFFALLLVTSFLISGWLPIIAFLVIDFFMRAGKLGKYSVLGLLSDGVVRWLKLGNKPVDRAPKRFATCVGFVFCAAMFVLSLLNQFGVAQIAGGVLLIFAALEAFAGFCAGCYVYTASLLLFKKPGN